MVLEITSCVIYNPGSAYSMSFDILLNGVHTTKTYNLSPGYNNFMPTISLPNSTVPSTGRLTLSITLT